MNTVQKIAKRLGEKGELPLATIGRVVKVLGEKRALAILEEALKVEAEGGMLTDDGERRRTPGGVFFKLVKNQTTSRERGGIFGPPPKSKTKAKPMSLQEMKVSAKEALTVTKGEASTVKVTIIGKPGRIIEKENVVITAMDSGKIPSLPKGLPQPPAEPTTYVVYIASKQWRKVQDSIAKNPDDKLIIEGYPVFDRRIGEHGALTVYAQSVTTKFIQQNRRAKQSL